MLSREFWAMAERFVHHVHRETNLAPIVCDDTGTIRKAHDRTRIGNVHSGARAILTGTIDEYAVTSQEAAANSLVKEGYSCAIVIDGAKVATFGIGGPLSITKPVAKTAALVMASWVRQLNRQDLLRDTVDRCLSEIHDLGHRLQRTANEFATVQRTMAQAARVAAESASSTTGIARSVERISEQTRILSLNAGIEAARLGRQGHVFAAMAGEMTSLSRETKEAMNVVESTMRDIREAISRVESAIQDSSAKFKDSTQLMEEVVPMTESIINSIQKLNDDFATDF